MLFELRFENFVHSKPIGVGLVGVMGQLESLAWFNIIGVENGLVNALGFQCKLNWLKLILLATQFVVIQVFRNTDYL